MKRIITLLALLTISTSTFARDNYGTISLNDGKNILRIDIGNERESDSREVSKRVARLERAVRELQNRVYDLEDDSLPATREVKIFTCTLPTSFDGTFIGKGKTEAEARANASNECKKGGAAFCNDRNIKSCETNIEIESIRR
jgi:hypothetical protein